MKIAKIIFTSVLLLAAMTGCVELQRFFQGAKEEAKKEAPVVVDNAVKNPTKEGIASAIFTFLGQVIEAGIKTALENPVETTAGAVAVTGGSGYLVHKRRKRKKAKAAEAPKPEGNT